MSIKKLLEHFKQSDSKIRDEIRYKIATIEWKNINTEDFEILDEALYDADPEVRALAQYILEKSKEEIK